MTRSARRAGQTQRTKFRIGAYIDNGSLEARRRIKVIDHSSIGKNNEGPILIANRVGGQSELNLIQFAVAVDIAA